MDAQSLREITRLHWLDLHAQLHYMRGKERGRTLWMIRGARLEMMAKARLEALVLGGSAARNHGRSRK